MKEIACQQYSREWWAARRGVPTASNFHRIITPTGKPSKQAEAYAHQLIGERLYTYYGQQEDYVTAAMRNGTIMEPESRRYYEFHRECEVRQVGFCTTDDGLIGASPDSLVDPKGSLELKNPNAATQVGYLLANELPSDYKPQVHGQLLVTQRQWVDFMSYCPGLPPLLIRVVPDEYTLLLAEALEVFLTLYQLLWERIAGTHDPIPSSRTPVEPYF